MTLRSPRMESMVTTNVLLEVDGEAGDIGQKNQKIILKRE